MNYGGFLICIGGWQNNGLAWVRFPRKFSENICIIQHPRKSVLYLVMYQHRIKISNRRATQRCNVSSFFYAQICSLLARRRSSQPVQRVYWPENVIDWLGKWRSTCVMRHARGPFKMDLYSMVSVKSSGAHPPLGHSRGISHFWNENGYVPMHPRE